MRGFRASRASQNSWSSRFGRQNSYDINNSSFQNPSGQQQKKIPLPDWLKMPSEKNATQAASNKKLKLLKASQDVSREAPKRKEISAHQNAKLAKTTKSPSTAATRKRKAA